MGPSTELFTSGMITEDTKNAAQSTTQPAKGAKKGKSLVSLQQWDHGTSQGQQKAVAGIVSIKKGNTIRLFKISSSWAPFFNYMLLSSDNFEWATEFLSSLAAAIISNNDGNVLLPNDCTSKQRPCLLNCDDNNNPDLDGQTMVGTGNSRTSRVFIQEAEEMEGDMEEKGVMEA